MKLINNTIILHYCKDDSRKAEIFLKDVIYEAPLSVKQFYLLDNEKMFRIYLFEIITEVTKPLFFKK